ncbi:FAD-dependent monooxygenase [Rickettsiales bacterium]|nr:FAD-dependent monooxygenase [Rickettsiales bacterium]
MSQGTKRILIKFNLWKFIEKYVQPIEKINVIDSSMYKNLNFDSKVLNEGDLGFIIENNLFKNFLISEVTRNKFITVFDKTDVKDIKIDNLDLSNKAKVIIKKKTITSNLIISADGRFSRSRYYLNIKNYCYFYEQNAYVFIIQHENDHKGIALEKFFPEGPLAILPMRKKNKNYFQSSVVWTLDENLGDFSKLSEKEFKSEFLMRYNNYLGKVFTITKPKIYPLSLTYTYEAYKNRIVFIGESSQGIHPIAGQGFNLGVRDCSILMESLISGIKSGIDIGSPEILSTYASMRKVDKGIFITSTHLLNKLFSNRNSILSFLRSNGLRAVDNLPFLKKSFMKLAMGLKSLS